MYWYKRSIRLPALVLLLTCLQSCKQDGSNTRTAKTIFDLSSDTRTTNKFFDLKGFFRTDSIKLAKANPLVNKTVTHNKSTENQKLHIANWGNELSLFSESDINKPAWQLSYKIQASDGFLIYKALDPNLKTRDIIIKRDGNKVKWILIFNHTKNILYETEEKLSYYPDSLYIVEKVQKVRLMGKDSYKITGAFGQ